MRSQRSRDNGRVSPARLNLQQVQKQRHCVQAKTQHSPLTQHLHFPQSSQQPEFKELPHLETGDVQKHQHCKRTELCSQRRNTKAPAGTKTIDDLPSPYGAPSSSSANISRLHTETSIGTLKSAVATHLIHAAEPHTTTSKQSLSSRNGDWLSSTRPKTMCETSGSRDLTLELLEQNSTDELWAEDLSLSWRLTEPQTTCSVTIAGSQQEQTTSKKSLNHKAKSELEELRTRTLEEQRKWKRLVTLSQKLENELQEHDYKLHIRRKWLIEHRIESSELEHKLDCKLQRLQNTQTALLKREHHLQAKEETIAKVSRAVAATTKRLRAQATQLHEEKKILSGPQKDLAERQRQVQLKEAELKSLELQLANLDERLRCKERQVSEVEQTQEHTQTLLNDKEQAFISLRAELNLTMQELASKERELADKEAYIKDMINKDAVYEHDMTILRTETQDCSKKKDVWSKTLVAHLHALIQKEEVIQQQEQRGRLHDSVLLLSTLRLLDSFKRGGIDGIFESCYQL